MRTTLMRPTLVEKIATEMDAEKQADLRKLEARINTTTRWIVAMTTLRKRLIADRNRLKPVTNSIDLHA